MLNEFSTLSGLKCNPAKSTVFCIGVSQVVKDRILGCLQMKEGKLPVRYLGVPLISSRVTAADCSVLLEKITGWIDSWMFKKLSFAGRLQLISSVLCSIQEYWTGIFILPKRIIKLFEQKLCWFLWNGKDDGVARATVAWKFLCLPKREGGLGIKKLE